MNVDRSQKLQDYLDGVLSPGAEIEVRRLAESDENVRVSLEEMRRVMILLNTPLDVEPPADLAAAAMSAVRADIERRARARRIPAFVENALVVAGTAVLAALVVGGRTIEAAGWVGRLTVWGTQAGETAKNALVAASSSLSRLDWVAGLFATLSDVGQTVLVSSAQPLMTLSLVTVTLAAVVAFVLLRTERLVREGGLRNVGLLS